MQGITKVVDERIETAKNDIMVDVLKVEQNVSLLKTRIGTTTNCFKSNQGLSDSIDASLKCVKQATTPLYPHSP